jgi:hypothetical protein
MRPIFYENLSGRSRTRADYQTLIRRSGNKKSFWPGLTLNAAYQEFMLRTTLARRLVGE